jgi:uncharacterized membrane protein
VAADGIAETEATQAPPGGEPVLDATTPRRPGPPASLPLALAAAAVGLVLAYFLKQPCATHSWVNNFQFSHLCYNDIQPLFHVRGIGRNLIPYKDIQVEYPVLTGTFMYVVGRLLAFLFHHHLATAYSDPSYFELTALLLAPVSVAVTLMLRPRVTAGRLMIWAIGTPTIFYSFLNWDLLAVAAMVWAVVEIERRQWGNAGVALALGASAKLFPAFLFPGAFLAALATGNRRSAVRLVLGFAAAGAVVNVPWMVVAFSRWMGIWKFHAGRYPDFGTIWYWVAQAGGRVTHSPWWGNFNGGYEAAIGVGGLAVFALATAYILWRGWQRRSEADGYPVAATGLAIIASFMVLSKVHSPQYALWITPLLVMVDVPWWEVLWYLGADALLFVSGFSWYTDPHPFTHTPGWEKIFATSVFIRAAALAALAITAAHQGRRLFPQPVEPAGVPVDAPAGAPAGEPATVSHPES